MAVNACVSRSLARSPARRQQCQSREMSDDVSVDHWRARLRARRGGKRVEQAVRCQSIIGALACAPAIHVITLGTQLQCQSIIGALACAPQRPPTGGFSVEGVSRSLARSPARLGKIGKKPIPGPCQSIIGALACAPAASLTETVEHERVSRSLARSPARLCFDHRISFLSRVSVDHWRARLRAVENV